METPDSTPNANTLKGHAHQYARATGIKYTAALTLMTDADDLVRRTGMPLDEAVSTVTVVNDRREFAHRWVLTDELRNWIHGEGWHGLWFDDLYGLIDRLDPDYVCDWCAEDGDARREDSTVEFIVTAYDPDLSPQTHHIATKKFHARCKAGGITWARPVLEASEPCVVSLPSSARPDLEGEFVITARPFLSADPDMPPVLFLSAEVEGPEDMWAPWINEVDLVLRNEGFCEANSWPLESPPPWSLRVMVEGPQLGGKPWLGLRTGPLPVGDTPFYLFVGEPALLREDVDPGIEAWAERAHGDGQVLVAFGPTTAYNTVPVLDLAALAAEEVEDLLTGEGHDEENDLPLQFLTRLVDVADPTEPARVLPRAQENQDAGR